MAISTSVNHLSRLIRCLSIHILVLLVTTERHKGLATSPYDLLNNRNSTHHLLILRLQTHIQITSNMSPETRLMLARER